MTSETRNCPECGFTVDVVVVPYGLGTRSRTVHGITAEWQHLCRHQSNDGERCETLKRALDDMST